MAAWALSAHLAVQGEKKLISVDEMSWRIAREMLALQG
jgi:hypothetical protein